MKTRRAINEKQMHLYLAEWGKVRRKLRETMTPKEADAQRHALTVEALGMDKSSKEFTNEDLDAVLKRFRAILRPADLGAQLDDQAVERGRWKVRELLAALGQTEAEAEALIARRREGGALVTVETEAGATFAGIGPADLERIALDLKAECRRRWARKGDLLTEIRVLRMSYDFDEAATNAEVAAVLKRQPLPALETLDYEELLKVVAVLRGMMKAEVPF